MVAMNLKAPDPPADVRVDQLLGRDVHTQDNKRLGPIEEFRAEQQGQDFVVTEYLIGRSGLLERLGVGVRLLFGRHIGGYVARWDQIDISRPERPRLRCTLNELRKR
jgi:hypothetical protein